MVDQEHIKHTFLCARVEMYGAYDRQASIYYGFVAIGQKEVSFLVRCPHFRGFLIEVFHCSINTRKGV